MPMDYRRIAATRLPAARIGALLLCLMASLPFLLPVHTTPIPSFHAEWLAAGLGLAASVVLLGAARLPLPGASLLALALAAIAALQGAMSRAPVPQLTELFTLYLLWAALLASAASHVAQALGLAKLTLALAAAILLGSVLAALAAIFQPWLAQAIGWPGFGPASGGPLGQRNHFTDYLWLGLASALYLRNDGKLPPTAFWSTAVLLTLAAALAGQRSSFLYAAALVGVSFWQGRRLPGTAAAAGKRLSITVALLFLLMQPIAAILPKIANYEGTPPPAARALSAAIGPSIRLQLVHLGIRGIQDTPLLGNGIGSFPGFALTYADEIPVGENPGPAEHAHNVFIDLAAELGLPAAILALAAAIVWMRNVARREEIGEACWALTVFAIVGLHSMIEYSLWHAYFLGLLVVVAGAFGSPRFFGRRLAPEALSLGLIAWGTVSMVDLARDYKFLETSLARGGSPSTMPEARAALLRIPPTSLLSPWVNTTACVSLDPQAVILDAGLAVCRVAVTFAPTPESGINIAILKQRTGDAQEAKRLRKQLQLVWRANARVVAPQQGETAKH